MRLLDDLMRKLSGGYGFSIVDLADEYNQIKLGPESQKRLALSSHEECCCNVAFPLISGSHGQTDNRPSGCHCLSGRHFCQWCHRFKPSSKPSGSIFVTSRKGAKMSRGEMFFCTTVY